MASIETRENYRSGTVHRVRYRHEGRNRAETFGDLAEAEAFRDMVNAIGVTGALAALNAVQAHTGVQTGRTVAAQVRHHIDHLTGVEDGTRSDYLTYLAVDIEPHLGKIPLAALTRDHVADWINRLEDKRGLSRKSIMNRHSLLSAALRSAVRDQIITTNVAEGVRMPTRDHEAVEMVTLTLPEVWRFIESAKRPEHTPLLIFLFGTGVRFGEATALRVGDVDLTTWTARIRQAWKHTDGHGHRLGAPKSRRSVRTVVFGRDVAAAIEPLLTGRPADAYVFTNSRGGPIRRSNFHSDIWTPALRTFAGDTCTKIPTGGRPKLEWTEGPGKRPRPHDARHTYASLQIARRASMALVQRQLGHESIQTTINTYTHLQTADMAELGGTVDRPLDLEQPKALD